jgi:hypothetical protein
MPTLDHVNKLVCEFKIKNWNQQHSKAFTQGALAFSLLHFVGVITLPRNSFPNICYNQSQLMFTMLWDV